MRLKLSMYAPLQNLKDVNHPHLINNKKEQIPSKNKNFYFIFLSRLSTAKILAMTENKNTYVCA